MAAVLLFVYKHRHHRADGKDAHLLDDDDDERANIMVYHTEGGGEEDQVRITDGYQIDTF